MLAVKCSSEANAALRMVSQLLPLPPSLAVEAVVSMERRPPPNTSPLQRRPMWNSLFNSGLALSQLPLPPLPPLVVVVLVLVVGGWVMS